MERTGQSGQLTREALSAMMGDRPRATQRIAVGQPTRRIITPVISGSTVSTPALRAKIGSAPQNAGRATQSVQRPIATAARRVARPAVPRPLPRPVRKQQPAEPKAVIQPPAQPKAVARAAVAPITTEPVIKKISKKTANPKKSRLDKKIRHKLAGLLSLTVLSAGVLGYLIYLNLPDISAKVSAIAVGIDTTFPSYIPAGYRLEGLPGVTDGRVVLKFSSANDSYILTQEKSSLSSEALYDTVVRNRFAAADMSKERGLTIFISGNEAMWVNGGVLFTVTGSSQLTARQIHNLAASLQ